MAPELVLRRPGRTHGRILQPPWRPKLRLFRKTQTATPDVLPPEYLELYRLAVEMADRVSARRATANGYFATLLTGLAGVVALVQPFLPASEQGVMEWPRLAVGGVGFSIAVAWWFALRSYRHLNGAKFEVILAMEQRLPVAVFGDEWKYLDGAEKPWHDRYFLLSATERVIPIVFALLFGAILVWPWMEALVTWVGELLS